MKNNLPLVPANIADTLDISEGSIVSKILFANLKLQITLFAIANGESIDEHTTSKEVAIHIVSGTGEFYIENKWEKVSAGDMFYMPEKMVHAIKATSDFKFLLYQF